MPIRISRRLIGTTAAHIGGALTGSARVCARVYARGRVRVVACRSRDIARDISLRRRSTTSFGLDGLDPTERKEERRTGGEERKGEERKSEGGGRNARERWERR